MGAKIQRLRRHRHQRGRDGRELGLRDYIASGVRKCQKFGIGIVVWVTRKTIKLFKAVIDGIDDYGFFILKNLDGTPIKGGFSASDLELAEA